MATKAKTADAKVPVLKGQEGPYSRAHHQSLLNTSTSRLSGGQDPRIPQKGSFPTSTPHTITGFTPLNALDEPPLRRRRRRREPEGRGAQDGDAEDPGGVGGEGGDHAEGIWYVLFFFAFLVVVAVRSGGGMWRMYAHKRGCRRLLLPSPYSMFHRKDDVLRCEPR